MLRVKPGEAIECFDGRGRRYRGAVARVSDRELAVQVETRADDPPPKLAITLAQSLIKPEHFEWAIQKATELGAARILPLLAERSTVRAAEHGSANRLARWARIAEAAVAQCGRARVPAIESPQGVSEALTSLRGGRGLFLTPAETGRPIADAARELVGAGEATIFIGPEGDFSPSEIAAAKQAGLMPVRLGPNAVRAETAAVAALVVVQCLAGEWHV